MTTDRLDSSGQLALPQDPVDRSEAVNLARNVLNGMQPTPKGIRTLAEGVMKMDEARKAQPVAWMIANGADATVHESVAEMWRATGHTMVPLYRTAPAPGPGVVPEGIVNVCRQKWAAMCKRYERVGSNWHKEMPAEWPVTIDIPVGDLRALLSALPGEQNAAQEHQSIPTTSGVVAGQSSKPPAAAPSREQKEGGR